MSASAPVGMPVLSQGCVAHRGCRNGTGVPPAPAGMRDHHVRNSRRQALTRSDRWGPGGSMTRPPPLLDPKWSYRAGAACHHDGVMQVLASNRAARPPLAAVIVGGTVGIVLVTGGLFLAWL